MAVPRSAIPTRPRLRAGTAAAAGALALLLALFGAAAGVLVEDAYIRALGRQALAVSVLLASVAAAIGIRDDPARISQDVRVGGLRSVTLLLRVASLAAIGLLAVAVLQHLQGLGLPPGLGLTEFITAALLCIVLNGTHLLALAEPPARPRTFVTRLAVMVGLFTASVLALLAWLAYRDQSGFTRLDASAGGPATLALAATIITSFAMMAAQGLPTIREILIKHEEEVLPGGSPRSLVLPVVVAFSLLVLSVLLFVLFGVGVVGVLNDVANNPLILVAFAVVVIGIGAAVLAALRLARTEEERQATLLYRPLTDPRAVLERRTLVGSLVLAALLLVAAAGAYGGWLPIPTVAWLHLATFGLLAGLGPYGFLVAREHKRIRRLEERFPDFLREMASSHKGGLTLAESLRISSRSDYGPLTDEVRRMADQVAWNVPFTEALQRFSDRVQTPLIQRAVNLVLEADRSGGASTDVLLAAARDAREIKTLENERRISMSLYTIVIYITFFVFLGVAAVLYSQFVPQLVAGAEASKAAATTSGGAAGLATESLRVEQFQLFYFLAALVQALGDGIVAGLMGTGRAVLGLRHSFLMVVFTYLTFAVFVQ